MVSTTTEPVREGKTQLPLLASIVNSSDDAIISKTLDGVITSWNKAAEEMYGYTAKQIVGKSISLLMPAGSTEMRDILEKINRGQRVDHFQTIRRRRDGTTVPISLTVSPICDRTGAVIGASSIARDITAQARANCEMARLNDLYARTQEISKTGGWEYDIRSGQLMWTDELYRIYGLDPASGQPQLDQAIAAFDAESLPVIDAAFRRVVADGEPYDLELRLVRADGAPIWVRANGGAVIENDQIVRVAGVILDITERKRTEDELQAVNEALGRLSAQLADASVASDAQQRLVACDTQAG